VKILAVSDEVARQIYCSDVRSRYPDVELVIGCGDLPFYYLEFLISALDIPLIYVLGNHDADPQHTSDGRILTSVQGGIDLHHRVKLLQGRLFAGIQGSMRYRPHAPLMYTEREMRNQLLTLIPRLLVAQWRYNRRLDVFVTHSPPFGVHDDQDLPHTGFRSFHPFLRYFKPRYLLHGHVHKYGPNTPRQTQVGETTVINVFPYRQLVL